MRGIYIYIHIFIKTITAQQNLQSLYGTELLSSTLMYMYIYTKMAVILIFTSLLTGQQLYNV